MTILDKCGPASKHMRAIEQQIANQIDELNWADGGLMDPYDATAKAAHINALKGVVLLVADRAHQCEALEEKQPTLNHLAEIGRSLMPPLHGQHGGKLTHVKAFYEDSSPREYGAIKADAFERARLVLL